MKKFFTFKCLSICLAVISFSACTNYKNAEEYEVGEYIERHFGSQSSEYQEYRFLRDQHTNNLKRCWEQKDNYGDESEEFYTAQQEVIKSDKLLLSYYEKIGATKAAELIRCGVLPAHEERAVALEKILKDKEQFLNNIIGIYRSEYINYMGNNVCFRITLNKNKYFVMEIVDSYSRVLSSQSGSFSPVADKNGCVLNPNTSNSSWIDVISSTHIRLGDIDLYN